MNPSLELHHQIHRDLAHARRLFALGHHKAACAQAARALRLDPGHLPARLLQARILLRLHQPDETLRVLNAFNWYQVDHPERSPSPAQLHRVHLLRATACAQLGRLDDARHALEALLQTDPGHPVARYRLAALHLVLDQPDQAIHHLEHLLHRHPRHRRALLLLADAYEAADQPERALDLRAQLQPAHQTAPAHRHHQARLLQRANRLSEALDSLDQLAREVDDPDLAMEAVDLAQSMGDTPRALATLTRTTQQHPDAPAPRRRLAEMHLAAGRLGPAAGLWWRLWRKHPNDGSAMAGLLHCALRLGRDSFAARLAHRFARTFSPEARQAEMLRLAQCALPGQIASHLLQTTQNDPPASSPLTALLTESARALDRRQQAHPDHADARYHLAVCQTQLGQADAAGVHLDTALALNPRYAAALQLRLRLLLDEHDLPAARRLLDHAQDSGLSPQSLGHLEPLIHLLEGHPDAALAALADAAPDPETRADLAQAVAEDLARLHHHHLLTAWQRLTHRATPALAA